jgi:hypothetical protein
MMTRDQTQERHVDQGTPTSAEAEWNVAVRALFTKILVEDGDEPAELADGDISTRGDVASVLEAACHAVARLRERRGFVRPPYSRQETRVVDYLIEATEGIGGGVDPVGFFIASAAFQANTTRKLRARVVELEKRLKAASLPYQVLEDADLAAADAYERAVMETCGIAATRDVVGGMDSDTIRINVSLSSEKAGDRAARHRLDRSVHAAVEAISEDLVGRVALILRVEDEAHSS